MGFIHPYICTLWGIPVFSWCNFVCLFSDKNLQKDVNVMAMNLTVPWMNLTNLNQISYPKQSKLNLSIWANYIELLIESSFA